MANPVSPSRQRSLFCECNKTPCQCWPSTSTTRRSRSRSQSRPPQREVPAQRLHYTPAQSQQLQSPHTPSAAYPSPTSSHHSSNHAASPSLAVPGQAPSTSPNSTPRSPQMSQMQLHPLLKAQSILRTPESPSALRLSWDVRDPPTTSVILSNHEPEYLYQHPTSVAYATSPPVPYILVACEGVLPWLVTVHAKEGSAGVTVRDVLETIHGVWYTPVDKNMLNMLSDEEREKVKRTYWGRIERNGDDHKGLVAVDWQGEKTMFVSLEKDEALARKRVKEESMWPYFFSLKLKLRKGALVSDA